MATLDTGIDDHELKQLIKDMSLVDKAMAFNAIQTLRSVSFAVEKEVKQRMPVDTGRARASWGHGGGDDSIYEDSGTSIKQGSNVEYIEYLNNGHSRQAPAGFIDMSALKGEITLQELLGNLDPLSAKEQRAEIDMALVGSKLA